MRPAAAALGAVLAFPLLAVAPSARADVLDDVIDQALSAGDATELFQQLVYTPLHDGVQEWLHSSIGEQIDHVVNAPFIASTGRELIGDGTPGTEADPTGGAGGWLFGDGGPGWNSTTAGTAGGDGGAAGLFGTGGEGGSGGAGAAGGDGGTGGGLFGSGGDGGSAGNGTGADGLPALGGAGGLAGLFGSHGDVGHSGTLEGAAPSGSSDLTATGNWFTNNAGQVVMLHGMKLINKEPPYEPAAIGFDDAKAQQLEDSGINAVRLGVEWAGVEPQPGQFDDAYLASLAQTIQILSDHHIRVILDMHQDGYSGVLGHNGAPAWAVDTGGLPNPDLSFPLNYPFSPAGNHAWDAFWSNTQVQDGVKLENSYAQMWEHVANYFKDDPDIVGYEMMNEPWVGSHWVSTLLGNPHFDAQELTPFYNQVDAAIRAVDPNTPVYFEPNVMFGNMPVNTHLGTVDDPNSVFAFHPYCITAALLGGTSSGCTVYENLIDGWAEHYAKAHDIPAMITEFGNTDNSTVINIAMDAADQHHFGWLFWPLGLYPSDSNLETLAQPYPEAVSGTPDSWSFENGTFQLSYSTAMADGQGSFASGSRTDISTPASEFPNGYQVDVTGGHVVSPANATTLVIASDAGASTVHVTVTPTGGAS